MWANGLARRALYAIAWYSALTGPAVSVLSRHVAVCRSLRLSCTLIAMCQPDDTYAVPTRASSNQREMVMLATTVRAMNALLVVADVALYRLQQSLWWQLWGALPLLRTFGLHELSRRLSWQVYERVH